LRIAVGDLDGVAVGLVGDVDGAADAITGAAVLVGERESCGPCSQPPKLLSERGSVGTPPAAHPSLSRRSYASRTCTIP